MVMIAISVNADGRKGGETRKSRVQVRRGGVDTESNTRRRGDSTHIQAGAQDAKLEGTDQRALPRIEQTAALEDLALPLRRNRAEVDQCQALRAERRNKRGVVRQ